VVGQNALGPIGGRHERRYLRRGVFDLADRRLDGKAVGSYDHIYLVVI